MKASFSKPSSLLLVWPVLPNNDPSETTANVMFHCFFVSENTFLMMKTVLMYNLIKVEIKLLIYFDTYEMTIEISGSVFPFK